MRNPVHDPEIRRQLAIELFRRLRSSGVIPVVFVPVLAYGTGYTEIQPKTAAVLVCLNLVNVP